MLVGKWMTPNPVTISEDADIDDALHVMRERRVRRLPVIDEAGQMIGIVSDKDLLHAAPSPVTSLSVHELRYLLAKLTVKKVMSSPVITVTPDMPLEQAARIMIDNKIGGLPVVEHGQLVGIITETDIFKVLLNVLGTRTPGIRVTLAVQERKGVLAALTHDISAMGANIISLLTSEGELPGERAITIKVNDADPVRLRQVLERLSARIIDFREA